MTPDEVERMKVLCQQIAVEEDQDKFSHCRTQRVARAEGQAARPSPGADRTKMEIKRKSRKPRCPYCVSETGFIDLKGLENGRQICEVRPYYLPGRWGLQVSLPEVRRG
jgi:hypothetical protein